MDFKLTADRTRGSHREIAISIGEDLRALVVVLTGLFEREIEDSEVLVHILNAKFAAERGLVLSERLAEISDGERQQRKVH